MTDNKMLSQAEIDALLRGNFSDTDSSTDNEDVPDPVPESPSRSVDQFDELLDESERDALGEIGNISMGSASTTLSELLRQKVTITSPKVVVMTQRELFESFRVPYIVIQVEFKAGLTGYNVLVIKGSGLRGNKRTGIERRFRGHEPDDRNGFDVPVHHVRQGD